VILKDCGNLENTIFKTNLKISSNFVVEWLILLLRIWEVQISAQRWAILTEVFHGFPQSLQENVG
jgi:hypothetical protein